MKGLSGGERARVLLLKLMLSKANLLILDEPTNHLDIGSCEALENALLGYDGTLFVVSHDRYLINKLADKIYYLTPSGTTLYLGNYDAYLEARQKQEAAKPLPKRKMKTLCRKPIQSINKRKSVPLKFGSAVPHFRNASARSKRRKRKLTR